MADNITNSITEYKEIAKFMEELSPGEILRAILKTYSPPLVEMEHLFKDAGTFIGGFVEKWTWRNLESYSDYELMFLIMICRAHK